MKKEYLDVGKVLATFGVKGAVKVEPWMNTPEDFAHLKVLYLEEGKRALEVEEASVYKGMIRVQFAGIHSIDEAAFLRNRTLYMRRKDFPLKEGAYFLQDLIGVDVLDVDSGQKYGILEEIIETMGANRVYTIRTPDGKQLLIPVIPEVIIETDLDEGILRIRPLDGLFDAEEILPPEGE